MSHMATKSEDTKDAATDQLAPDEEKEAALEDLVDELGADPTEVVDNGDVAVAVLPDAEPGTLADQSEPAGLPDGLDGRNAQTDVEPANLVLDQTDLVDEFVEDPDEVEPEELIPDVRPDHLADQGDAEFLPDTDRPNSADHGEVGDSDAVPGGPADQTDIDPAELGFDDQTLLDPDLTELVDPGASPGGLDGRNDGGDGYSGPGQPGPNSEEELAELDDPSQSASDSLHDVNLEKINDILDSDLSEEDKQSELDKLADSIHGYQNGPDADAEESGPDAGVLDAGGSTTEASKENDGKDENGEFTHTTGPSLGAASDKDTKFAINKKTGEVEIIPKDQPTEGSKMGSEAAQMKETGTAASSPQNQGDKPDEKASTPEDTTQDLGHEAGYDAPDPHADFAKGVFDHQAAAEAGAEVNPNPNDDGDHASIAEVPTDTDPFTAEYEDGYVPIDESVAQDRADNFDITPDEEFMDLG